MLIVHLQSILALTLCYFIPSLEPQPISRQSTIRSSETVSERKPVLPSLRQGSADSILSSSTAQSSDEGPVTPSSTSIHLPISKSSNPHIIFADPILPDHPARRPFRHSMPPPVLPMLLESSEVVSASDSKEVKPVSIPQPLRQIAVNGSQRKGKGHTELKRKHHCRLLHFRRSSSDAELLQPPAEDASLSSRHSRSEERGELISPKRMVCGLLTVFFCYRTFS